MQVQYVEGKVTALSPFITSCSLAPYTTFYSCPHRQLLVMSCNVQSARKP